MDAIIENLIYLLFLIGLVFVAMTWLRETSNYPYVKAGPLLTPAELNFYRVLQGAVPPGHALTVKVRLGDILVLKKGLSRKRALIMGAKIQQKHIDFVLCRASDMVPVCCIELNDASHNRKDRRERDKFVRGACAAAGMPILEVPAKRNYNQNELALMLAGQISTIEHPAQKGAA